MKEGLRGFAPIGILKQWSIGFWETAGVVYWQNPIDKEVNK